MVENRTGASGTIGAEAVARAVPDGLTLAVSHAIPFGFAPGVLPSVPYDPVADFVHIGMVAEASTVTVVRADSPFTTLSALIEATRRGPVRYGSSGVGSAEHILGAVIARTARTDGLDHVPYRGTAPALQDLMAGQIEALNAPITTLAGQLRDGTLRALATSAPTRLPAFPDLPTVGELGYQEATGTQWIGISAPRGTLTSVAERVAAALPPILAAPSVRSRLAEFASEPREPTPMGADFTRFVAAFRDEWVGKTRALGIVVT